LEATASPDSRLGFPADRHRQVPDCLAGRRNRSPFPDRGRARSYQLSVAELVPADSPHCRQYYAKNGEVTNPVRTIRLGLDAL